MASGINLSIGANTKEVQSAITTGMVEPLEQALQVLKELSESGDASGDALTEAMQKVRQATNQATDAQKALTVAQAKQTVSGGTAAPESSSGVGGATSMALEDIGDKAEESGKKVEEGSKVGESALMNLGYSASTAGEAFDGPSGLLQTVGSFAAFLGPSLLATPELAIALTVAGVAGSALGTILGNAGTESAAAAAQISAAEKTMLSAALGTASGIDTTDTALRDWAKDSSDFGITLTDLQESLKGTDNSYGQIAEAIASKNVPAMQKFKSSIDEQIQSLVKQENTVNAASNGSSALGNQYGKQADSLQKVSSALKTNITESNQVTQVEKSVAAALGLTLKQYEAKEKAAAASAAAVKAAGTAEQTSINNLVAANGKSLATMLSDDKANNDESVADFIKGNQQKISILAKETADETAIYQKFGPTAGAEIIKDVPADSPLFDRLAHATPAQAAQIKAQYSALATQAAEAAQAAANAHPISVKVIAEESAIQASLQRLQQQTVTVGVNLVPLGTGSRKF